MKFKKNTAIIDGKTFFYWERNPHAKTTMVLLHGFPGTHRGLIHLAENLGGWRLIIPDLPGCGQSEPLRMRHTLKHYSEWLAVLLKELKIHDAVVVGHSFGARLALLFTVHHPDKVKNLVLITPVVKADSLISRIGELYYKVAEIIPSVFQEKWLSNRFYAKISNRILLKSVSRKREYYLANAGWKEVQNLTSKIRIEVFDDFYKSKFISEGAKIDIKTLLIASDEDQVATLNSIKELSKRFTNAKLEVIKRSGHLVPIERPLQVASVIKSWL